MFTLKTHTRARMCSSHHRNSTYVTPNFDEVVEANPVIGENDAVVKIRVEDISQLDKFLTDKLRTLPDVFLTTTMIITEQFK